MAPRPPLGDRSSSRVSASRSRVVRSVDARVRADSLPRRTPSRTAKPPGVPSGRDRAAPVRNPAARVPLAPPAVAGDHDVRPQVPVCLPLVRRYVGPGPRPHDGGGRASGCPIARVSESSCARSGGSVRTERRATRRGLSRRRKGSFVATATLRDYRRRTIADMDDTMRLSCPKCRAIDWSRDGVTMAVDINGEIHRVRARRVSSRGQTVPVGIAIAAASDLSPAATWPSTWPR